MRATRCGAFGLLALAVAWLSSAAVAEVPVPRLEARVTDLAGLLSQAQRSALETELAALESETTHQVAVLTVPALEGEPVESFSMRVVEQWQLGQKGLDNGVLVLVARDDRKARIEVGYGLEGVLPDAVASRIMRERMIPRFRAGDMGAGILAGVEAVSAAARGEVIPEARRPRDEVVAYGDPMAAVLFCALFGGLLGATLTGRRRVPGAVVGAGLAGVGAWVLLSTVPWSALAAALGGAFGAVGPGGMPLGGGRIGIPGSYGGRGGGFGGGGFGGGGGGFGGGGASGSW